MRPPESGESGHEQEAVAPPERRTAGETIRGRGMRHFVWHHGVLRWGGFMFFSMAVFQYSRFGSLLSTQGNWLFRLALAAVTWIFVGSCLAQNKWNKLQG